MIKLIISTVSAVKKDAVPIGFAGTTAGTGIATRGTGAIESLEWIPPDIGWIGILIGILATIITTGTTIYSRILENKHTILQTRILERQASEDFSDFTIED